MYVGAIALCERSYDSRNDTYMMSVCDDDANEINTLFIAKKLKYQEVSTICKSFKAAVIFAYVTN